jgi:predicted amidophosphoribosyltransferase
LAKIELLPYQVCPKCEKLLTEKGALCDHCKKAQPALSNLVVATKYKDNNLSKLVHLYKYNFVEDLHVPLGRLLVKTILKNNMPLPDLIVPVPLHPRRLRWRGFNQAELLANYVSENLTPGFTIPVVTDLIRRQKYTPPQMQIGKYADRRKNILAAFQINSYSASFSPFLRRDVPLGQRGKAPQEFLQDKKILLIDDIATTGATLFECAKIIKQNGAKKVMGTVIARQEFES